MNPARKIAFCLLACLYCDALVAAPVPAIDIDPGVDVADPPGPGQYRGYDFGHIDWVIGWSFVVEEPVTLTHLAWYDEDGDGLSHDLRLGLWRAEDSANFELVVELTLPSGTGAELFGPWRRDPLADLQLQPAGYVIGGLDSSESMDVIKYVTSSDPLPLPIDPRLGEFTFGSVSRENVFEAPDRTLLAPGLFLGPMFFIEPVPEPGTLALLAIGAILVVPMVRSRIKCKA